MTWGDFLLRVGAALVLGSMIGLERQWRQRTAGLRTNALVAVGAALFVTLPSLFARDPNPVPMAAQVVTGIGFLGAGVILREGLNIQGLNTAATLWCAAAVGVLAGAGFVGHAGVGAGLVVLAHVLLRPVARRIDRQPLAADIELLYRLSIVCHSPDEQRIRAVLLHAVSQEGWSLHSLQSEDLDPPGRLMVRADIVTSGRADRRVEEIVGRISLDPSVSAVSWKILAEEIEAA